MSLKQCHTLMVYTLHCSSYLILRKWCNLKHTPPMWWDEGNEELCKPSFWIMYMLHLLCYGYEVIEPGKRLKFSSIKILLRTTDQLHLLVSATSWQWVHVFVQDKLLVLERVSLSLSYRTTNESLTITFNSHPMVETKKGLCLEEGYNTLLTLWLQCPPQKYQLPLSSSD